MAAAQYLPGRPLDDLEAVAKMADRHAELGQMSMSSGMILVVRWAEVPEIPGSHAAVTEYLAIPAGQFLCYSETYGILLSDTQEGIDQFYEPADG